MNSNKTRVLLAVVVLALVAAAWWWQRGGAAETVRYRTAKIERGAIQSVVAATGTVNPVSQVQVGTQVSGLIKELLVDFNSEVKRDQLIARIDPESFEYRLRQASADLEAARSAVMTAEANVQQTVAQASRADVELQEARRDLGRKQDLAAQGFISGSEVDSARAKAATLAEALKAAQAQVAVSRAQVQSAKSAVRQREAARAQAEVDLQRTQIRSPVDGIVIKRSVEVGQTVAASLQAPELFVIARNLSDMQVEASIDESDISRIRVGQAVSFTTDAFPGRNFAGAVRQIRKAAVNTQNVITYTVVSGFDNPGGQVLPGMTANVRIVIDSRDNALKVPNAALRVRLPGLEPAAASGAAVGDAGTAGQAPWMPGWLPSAQAQSPSPGAAPGNGSTRGGALATLRERLVQELKLDDAQAAKIDAVLAESRSGFAALRELPEAERGKARERLMGELRQRIAVQLPPELRPRFEQMAAELAGRQATRGRLYTLGPDGRPRAHDVRLGINDGTMTELLVPPGGPDAAVLVEGAEVVVGTVSAAAGTNAQRSTGPRFGF